MTFVTLGQKFSKILAKDGKFRSNGEARAIRLFCQLKCKVML